MHHLQRGAEDCEAQVAVGLPEGAREAVCPALEVSSVRDHLELVLVVGNDLGQFLLDELGVARLTTKPGQDIRRLVELAPLYKVSGRFREHQKTDTENKGPGHLDGDGDAVRASIKAVLRGVDDARRKQQANGDAKLVSGDDGAADLSRRDFRHVQDDDCRHESNAKPGNQAARYQKTHTRTSGRCLENAADEENYAASNDGGTATDPVREISSDDGSEKGTAGEDGDEQRLLGRADDEDVRGIVGGRGVGIRTFWTAVGVWKAGVLVDHVRHGQDAIDPARVIAEEDATEGSKGAHEVCLYRHGRFDARRVGGGDDACSTRHDEGLLLLSIKGLVYRVSTWEVVDEAADRTSTAKGEWEERKKRRRKKRLKEES